MEYEKIRELINDFGNSKLNNINLEFSDGTKINMQKNENDVIKVENKPLEISRSEKQNDNKNLENNPIQDGKIIKSPMVGTFYIKPSPTSNPYVEIGKKVKNGDVICIIEAMKLMNEIESEFSGEVKEIFVNDGDSVEYGEPLFKIV